MKIGVIIDNELNNDIRVLREIRILREQNLEIFVLCFGFKKTYKIPISQISIKRIYIPGKLRDILFFILNTIPLYEWMWAYKIKKFIASNKIDVLYVHDLYMAQAAHSGRQKSDKDIPLILDLHENYPFTVTTYNWTKGFFRNLIAKPDKWQRKEEKYLDYADGIIVLSNDYRDLLKSRYSKLSEKPFLVLPNVPDLSQLGQQIKKQVENPFKNNYPILFYYGVIAERRGVFDTFEVFINLVTKDYPVNFLLIGPVDKKDKLRFSKMLSIEILKNRVHYIPWIDSNELPDYLDICDICLAPFHKNPQHESGIANKIFEYMLGAKPLVVSNCAPQQNLIEKHNCGVVFKNITEFEDSIIKLLKDESLRKEMGKNGYAAVMKEYHSEIVKEEFFYYINHLSLSRSIN
ncbi:MAG TPA: glycosyltransferase family 4 protein [Bacteroidales bacterium]|nr:glycosyltransferase family 4 protein [Bacteroidales bacterium]